MTIGGDAKAPAFASPPLSLAQFSAFSAKAKYGTEKARPSLLNNFVIARGTVSEIWSFDGPALGNKCEA